MWVGERGILMPKGGDSIAQFFHILLNLIEDSIFLCIFGLIKDISFTMKEAINKALEVLRQGGLILYPNDSLWAIGCDACHAEAVARLRQLKGLRLEKPWLILLDNEVKVERYVEALPPMAYDLWAMSDKALTLIVDKPKSLAPCINSEAHLAVRLTKDAFSKRLLERFKRPILSTAALGENEETLPLTFSEINPELKNAVDYVVDYAQDVRLPGLSALIALPSDGTIKVIRA